MAADPAIDVDGLFAQAMALYRQGLHAQSDSALSQVLERVPDHFDAWHLRGVVASQLGRRERAVGLLRRAIELNAAAPAAHRHLGNALRNLGRLEEALASYAKAIECRPDFTPAYVNRGMTLLMLRQPAPALADFDRAIALGADDGQVHLYRSSALIDLNRPLDAAHGAAQAIVRQPDQPDAYVNQAIAYHMLARYRDAVESCERAIELDADHGAAHARRGAALYALLKLDEAQVSLDRAIDLDPDDAFAHAVRALCFLDAQNPEAALQSSNRALALNGALADAHNTRGLALGDLQRFEEAMESFDRAISLNPGTSEPYFNKAVRHLLKGDFARGWEFYERRPFRETGTGPVTSVPLFDGRQDLAGRTILVRAEQGLGDTLQFCRYAVRLRAGGARVILSVPDCLCALLRTLGGGIEVVGARDVPPAADFQCALLSLPRAFQTDLHGIPAEVPYLRPDAARVAMWRRRLGNHGRLIGIRWQGSTGRVDAGRSFPLRYFQRIAAIPGVRLISLQKHAGVEQLKDLPDSWQVEDLGIDFEPAGADAFLDVAAVMNCVELVITSDTSVAHLAGALARPTWLALKRVPDWRWMLDREDSPWYPTMRLFRQGEPGDWVGVFERMHAAFPEFLGSGGPPG